VFLLELYCYFCIDYKKLFSINEIKNFPIRMCYSINNGIHEKRRMKFCVQCLMKSAQCGCEIRRLKARMLACER
jgi:hypothetical protein